MTLNFKTSTSIVPYPEALARMEAQVAAIHAGGGGDEIWFLQHPPLYTAGSSAKPEHLTNPEQFPTYAPGRGGQWTYHGPGQLVVYLMLDLRKRYAPAVPDLKDFIRRLEHWIIATLAAFDIEGFAVAGRTGVWVTPENPKKIAAIGVRVRHGISYHGLSLNLHPDLSHYAGIIPCGIADAGVTSFHALGKNPTQEDVITTMQMLFTASFSGR